MQQLKLTFINYFLTYVQVECVQCVQLWRAASQRDTRACGPHAKTCKGNACFMRKYTEIHRSAKIELVFHRKLFFSGQCKHCPVYQYMSGCVVLTPWQIADLEVNRRRSELKLRRVGSELLCEDTFNQTTCICNRRDKCNSMYARLPFSTYGEGIFNGVVNFDQIIAELDPRYLEVISGYQYRFAKSSTTASNITLVTLLLLIVTVLVCISF
ncbi:unnamed protein product [Strongylus vulgaris]|uniref:Uncharacterized protein n=1 Tax=Strongylus vulgaris TaxID=40348 RepID=A0A3P7IQ75_STRVU|nr:unnamed protein product [Strongylus vulgaris]